MEKIVLVVDPTQLKQIVSEVFEEKFTNFISQYKLEKPEPPPEEYMKTEEVMILCKYSKGYIYELARKNKIPFERVGRSLRFARKDIEAWIKAKRPSIMQLALQKLHDNK